MKTRIIHKLYNALRIHYSETVPGIPGFGTGSGTLEPVPWNRFLRQITKMWLFRTLSFLGQTASRLPNLDMCKIQFWQFHDNGGHVFFHRTSQKTRTEI